MPSHKVCKQCKTIIEHGSKCPECGSGEISEAFKGKVSILNAEQSEIAKNLKLTKKGIYALRIG
ncbi:MAG: transcription elongation factor subunit Spt4 [Nanoarchaeota archaeon]